MNDILKNLIILEAFTWIVLMVLVAFIVIYINNHEHPVQPCQEGCGSEEIKEIV